MKRVEMYGDQRDIIEVLAGKLEKGGTLYGFAALAPALRGLIESYDAAEYDKGISVPQSDYDKGYAAGYEAGDRDCMKSWTRSNRQETA